MGQLAIKHGGRKVLIYLFGSLGDTLVAIPALKAVRRTFSDSELVLLQNVESGNIVRASEVIPDDLIDRYLNYSNALNGASKFSAFYRLRKELRKERFSAVVYLVISERAKLSVLRDRLFFRSCGIGKFFGFHAFSKDELFPVDEAGRPARSTHEAMRKLDRLAKDGVEVLPKLDLRQPGLTFTRDEIEPVRAWLQDRRSSAKSRLVAIAPGCKTVANTWPIGRFIEVGRVLSNELNCDVVITGGKAELEMGEEIVRQLGSGINAAGRFSVRESGILLSLCDAYIGLDTGTTHLAAAVGKPCFAIYGERNNPGHWYPLGAGHEVVSHKVDCAGCRQFACPIPEHPCMEMITSSEVIGKLRPFILNIESATGESL